MVPTGRAGRTPAIGWAGMHQGVTSCSRCCISPSAIPSVYTDLKEKQDQTPLQQLPQLLSRADPVSEGFRQPSAI